tara:strand:- start:5105 stop:5998 length:894 start_codon:yes stop_codon:yes gene_type:complete
MTGGIKISDEKQNRLAALRQRVQSKLIKSRIDTRRREKKAEDEIVVQSPQKEEIDFYELEDDFLSDGDRRRKIASAFVMIGALMGILSGTLILQGNPSGLLNSSIFESNEALRIHGSVLDQDGYPVEGVDIELVDPDSGSVIKSNLTDENGRYAIDEVLVKEYQLHVSKEGYEKVILIFKPEPIGISTITMVDCTEDVECAERTKDERSQTEGWSMENAVALATVEGLFTIGCALVGVHASFEIKRKKRYRRTQAFCWIGLFSRGLIIFGPALILLSMVLLMLNKDEFEDQQELEAF